MLSESETDDHKPAAIYKENSEKKTTNNKRTQVQNKKRSLKKKKENLHENEWAEYSKFMNANLEKKRN